MRQAGLSVRTDSARPSSNGCTPPHTLSLSLPLSLSLCCRSIVCNYPGCISTLAWPGAIGLDSCNLQLGRTEMACQPGPCSLLPSAKLRATASTGSVLARTLCSMQLEGRMRALCLGSASMLYEAWGHTGSPWNITLADIALASCLRTRCLATLPRSAAPVFPRPVSQFVTVKSSSSSSVVGLLLSFNFTFPTWP